MFELLPSAGQPGAAAMTTCNEPKSRHRGSFFGRCGAVWTVAAVAAIGLAPWASGQDTTEANDDAAAEEAVDDASSTDDDTSAEAGATAEALGRIFRNMFFSDSGGMMFEEEEEASPLVGQPAPAFDLQTPDGGSWRLQDAKGKVVVLDFWATWCGPCVAAMPQLQNLHEELQSEDAPALIVGVNQGETAEDVRSFLEEKQTTFAQVLDTEGTVGNKYAVSGIPQTVIIDGEGVVQAVHVGFSPTLGATLKKQIATVLDGGDLFDEEEMRRVREERMKETEQTRESIAEVHPESFEHIAPVEVGQQAYLSATTPNVWIKLPSGATAMAVQTGEQQILLIEPQGNTGRIVELQWQEAPTYWEHAAAITPDELRWVGLGYHYDDEYFELKKLTLTMFTESGEPIWSTDIPALGEYADISYEVGDFNRDGRPEIVALMGCTDVDLGPDDADVSRVLAAWDDGGKLLARKWIRGEGGTGLFVLPADHGQHWLMQGAEGLARMRLATAAVAEEPVADAVDDQPVAGQGEVN